MASFKEIVEIIGTRVDGVGVLLIVVGAIFATWRFLFGGKAVPPASYRVYSECAAALRMRHGTSKSPWRPRARGE